MWDIIRAFREYGEDQLGGDERNIKDDSTSVSSSDARRSELCVLTSPLNQYITIGNLKKELESVESRVNSILDETPIRAFYIAIYNGEATRLLKTYSLGCSRI